MHGGIDERQQEYRRCQRESGHDVRSCKLPPNCETGNAVRERAGTPTAMDTVAVRAPNNRRARRPHLAQVVSSDLAETYLFGSRGTLTASRYHRVSIAQPRRPAAPCGPVAGESRDCAVLLECHS